MKYEAKFTTVFHHWLKANAMHEAHAFEIKVTGVDFLPFSAVKPHQLDALLAAQKGKLVYKIPDDSRGIKPFDMIYLENAQAYVVIKYPGFFCFIDPQTFINERDGSKRKSLTALRAIEIATLIREI